MKDEDWRKLEKVGWKVKWYSDPSNCYCKGSGITKDGRGNTKECSGSYHNKDGRWLGALATGASKEFATIQEAKDEFEKITGQDTEDEGCSCCGPPHNFYED